MLQQQGYVSVLPTDTFSSFTQVWYDTIPTVVGTSNMASFNFSICVNTPTLRCEASHYIQLHPTDKS